MESKSTKQKILEAALILFSEKGYDGVGIDEIAESIGMKGPSIYRHFKGKEAILDALLDTAEEHFHANFDSKVHSVHIPSSIDELIEMSLAQLNFTMHDPLVKRMRRLFIIEQFRSERIGNLATMHSLTSLVGMYSKIFEAMMNAGSMKKGDAELLAFEYTSPISLLIQLVDRQPDREDYAMELIKGHFAYFAKLYSI